MTTYHVGAWLPLRTPEWDHPERLSTYVAARDQFLAQVKPSIATLTARASVSSARLATPPDDLLDWFKTKNLMAGTRLIEFVCIEGSAELDEAWHQQNLDAEELACRAVAVDELSDPLNLLLVLTELAYPGCIDTLDVAIVSDSLLMTSHAKKGAHTSLGFPENQVWPPIQTLELHQVVTWAKQTSFFSRALATTRIERALASYTHVVGLGWQRDGELLFRAMQGLEAFYIDGIGDLRRQLSNKVQLWLGPWEGNKNIVGHLYDLRSAFVHGSSRLIFWNRDGAVWDEDEHHIQQFDEHVGFAIRLLVATLQKCVQNGITSIEWSYVYEIGQSRGQASIGAFPLGPDSLVR